MIGFAVTLGGTDYTAYVQTVDIIAPATTAVPTATVTFNNTSGQFVNIPLYTTLVIQFGGVTYFSGVTETHPYTMDGNYGHTVAIQATSCPELVFMTEGNIQVVGSNLQVNSFGNYSLLTALTTQLTSGLTSGHTYTSLTIAATNVGVVSGQKLTLQYNTANFQEVTVNSNASSGSTTISVNSFVANYSFPAGSSLSALYVPYPTVWGGTTNNANLLDIGDVFAGLIHNPQPLQTSGYRGRLGYDVTGRGIKTTSFDLNPPNLSGPTITNEYELGLFVQGMFYTGPGSVGSTSTSTSGANSSSMLGSGREQYGIDLLTSLCQGQIVDVNGAPQFVDWFYDPTTNLINYFQHGSKSSGVTVSANIELSHGGIQLPVDIIDVKNDLVMWFNAENSYPNNPAAWSSYSTSTILNNFWSLTASGGGTATLTTSAITPIGYGASNQYTNTSSPAQAVTVQSSFPLHTNGYQNLSPYDAEGNTRGISSFNFYLTRAYNFNGEQVFVILSDSSGNKAQYDASSKIASAGIWANIVCPIPSSGSSGWTVTGTWDFSVNTISTVTFVLNIQSSGGTNDTFWIAAPNFTDNYYYSPMYSNFGPYIGETNPQTGSPYTSGLEITYDTNSINAYGDHIYNWNEYYTPGASDAAVGIAQSLLLSRRGKNASGTVTIFNPLQYSAIKPGYLMNVTDPKDTYVGTTYDTTIQSWLVNQIEYKYDWTNGFIGIYTVQPWYDTSADGSANPTDPAPNSPDTNANNPALIIRKSPGRNRAHMQKLTRFVNRR
jgi:hypothetical protein